MRGSDFLSSLIPYISWQPADDGGLGLQSPEQPRQADGTSPTEVRRLEPSGKPDLRGGTDIDDVVRELEREGIDFAEARREIAALRSAAGERPTLKDLQLRAGLSQQQLSAASGMEQPNIARLESGHVSDPKLSTLRRLAAALGTDLETVAATFAGLTSAPAAAAARGRDRQAG